LRHYATSQIAVGSIPNEIKGKKKLVVNVNTEAEVKIEQTGKSSYFL
jgi:hypothetical protein